MTRLCFHFALGLMIACPLAARADRDALDEALAKAAPTVLKHLEERKANAFGVLKFRIQKADGKLTDAAGELNMGLADRLENALILAAPDDSRIEVIHRASLVLGKKNPLANHATKEGRQDCFEKGKEYPLAWGTKTAEPQAFVTGIARFAKDLKTVEIQLQAFGADGEMVEIGKPISVAATRRTLVEAGYSYVLTKASAPTLYDGSRGPKKKIDTVAKQTVEDINEIKEDIAKLKMEDEKIATQVVLALNDAPKANAQKFTAAEAGAESPITLKIFYGDKEIKVVDDRVPEPLEGEKVRFVLENTSKDDMYGVVLKVNGKNTLFSEEAEPRACMKWLLSPGQKHEITGFQEDNDTISEFRIASQAESDENTVRYGELGGTVRMTVFKGKQVSRDPSEFERTDEPDAMAMVAAISRGAKDRPKGATMPGSLSGLQGYLRDYTKVPDGARGFIEKGARKGSRVDRIFFQMTPSVAIADISIRYYDPKK